MNYWTPIFILVASNVIYNICSKSTPANISPLAMLIVVYIIGAVFAGILYYATGSGDGLIGEFRHINWAGIVMGLSIVGLELGSIYMYKVGWEISVGFLLSSAVVAATLAIIGAIIYHEQMTLTKISGILVCLVGLFLINK